MSAAFHIAALASGAMGAVYWNPTGFVNLAIRLSYVGFTAWAAVMVAKDLL